MKLFNCYRLIYLKSSSQVGVRAQVHAVELQASLEQLESFTGESRALLRRF